MSQAEPLIKALDDMGHHFAAEYLRLRRRGLSEADARKRMHDELDSIIAEEFDHPRKQESPQ